mmetsp:Transcript_36963/g.80931  ORF Transcript_36963/g.80931 Transcript_36963/m.80931 type:complete len:359 (-) Transcript_36963:472-1548(-)
MRFGNRWGLSIAGLIRTGRCLRTSLLLLLLHLILLLHHLPSHGMSVHEAPSHAAPAAAGRSSSRRGPSDGTACTAPAHLIGRYHHGHHHDDLILLLHHHAAAHHTTCHHATSHHTPLLLMLLHLLHGETLLRESGGSLGILVLAGQLLPRPARPVDLVAQFVNLGLQPGTGEVKTFQNVNGPSDQIGAVRWTSRPSDVVENSQTTHCGRRGWRCCCNSSSSSTTTSSTVRHGALVTVLLSLVTASLSITTTSICTAISTTNSSSSSSTNTNTSSSKGAGGHATLPLSSKLDLILLNPTKDVGQRGELRVNVRPALLLATAFALHPGLGPCLVGHRRRSRSCRRRCLGPCVIGAAAPTV